MEKVISEPIDLLLYIFCTTTIFNNSVSLTTFTHDLRTISWKIDAQNRAPTYGTYGILGPYVWKRRIGTPMLGLT
jgi:hypothetical protein